MNILRALLRFFNSDIFKCDMCLKEIPEDDEVYHFSGTLNGKLNTHIHICDSCVIKHDLHKNFINCDFHLTDES
jgi:hypothetical protein